MTLNYWDMCNSILRCALCVRSNDSFNFPLGRIKYIFIVKKEKEEKHNINSKNKTQGSNVLYFNKSDRSRVVIIIRMMIQVHTTQTLLLNPVLFRLFQHKHILYQTPLYCLLRTICKSCGTTSHRRQSDFWLTKRNSFRSSNSATWPAKPGAGLVLPR